MALDTPTRLRTGDPAVAPFLDAASDDTAAACLEQLLGEDLHRVIRDVVRRELSGSVVGAAHADDVIADVHLGLVRKLWSLRQGRGEPIDDLSAYAARAAEHASYTVLRSRFPERWRFRNRVRYALGHQPSTTLARDAGGAWLCRTARAIRRVAESGAVEALIDDPRQWVARQRIDLTQPLPDILDEVLARLDRPIELDRLVDALAMVLGIADAVPLTRRDDPDLSVAETLPDPAPLAADVLTQRESLRRAWEEIVDLPPKQRSALLLNLRDPDGGAVLHLLPATGVVTQAEIAAALGMDEPVLAGLWNRLPLDDRSIAEATGLTRQQIINLRKSARARLARRLKVIPLADERHRR